MKVTDAAIGVLEAIDRPTGTVLRLEPDDNAGSMTLALGEPEAGDSVIERDGADVLHVPGPVSSALDGGVMDVVQTADGPRLTITRDEEAATP